MQPILFKITCLVVFIQFTLHVNAQDDLPTDYLTKEFHRGRREAARKLMPKNSVMVVFAAPMRTFSNDVEYIFNPPFLGGLLTFLWVSKLIRQ